MKIVTILFALLFVAGCWPIKSGTSIATSAGHAAGSLEAAHRGITAALPHADSIGKASLVDADGSISIVLVALAVLKAFSVNPIVNVAYTVLLALCTGCLSVLHSAVVWLINRFK